MKINKLAAICKRSETIMLYDKEDGGQWIGDGAAMYSAYDLPELNDDYIYAIFDIPEKKQKKMSYRRQGMPPSISVADSVPNENMLDPPKFDISVAGRILRPLKTQRGLIFIDTKYLLPLADADDYLELYERISTDGKLYVAVKNGFMLMAVILPYKIVTEDFVENMEELARLCKIAYENNSTDNGLEGNHDNG